MKVLKSKSFRLSEDLAAFVNSENILREDILAIKIKQYGVIIFYYGEADEKKKSSGWFS